MIDFEDMYEHSVMISVNLIEDVRFGRNMNFDCIKELSDQICEFLNNNSNILSMLHSIEDKNPYLYSHPVKVAFASYVIGKWMNYEPSELSRLVFTGLVHDLGKAKIRDSILNKPGKLSAMEIQTIRNHPVMGYRLLTASDIIDTDILSGVLSHHERHNGSGYPRMLQGNQIHKFGKIIAIADIYDAMTSKRPYSDKNTPFKAIEEIQDLSFGFLDPQISTVFLNNIINFYCGSTVRLNNDLVGEIIYINPEERTKPLIHCDDQYINLSSDRNLKIVELL